MPARSARTARAALVAVPVLAGAWVAWLLGSVDAGPLTGTLERWAAPAFAATAAAACLGRARLPWALLGLACLAWAGGELYDAVAPAPAIAPSPADALRLGFHPLAAGGVLALLWPRLRTAGPARRAGSELAALAAAALVAAVPLEAARGGGTLALAYPLADLALVGVLAGAAAAAGWPRDARLGWLAAGLLAFVAVDGAAVGRAAGGELVPAGLVGAGAAVGLLMIAWAAWRPEPPARPDAPARFGDALVPVAAGVAALAVLVREALVRGEPAATLLAAACLALVLARTALAVRQETPAREPAPAAGAAAPAVPVTARLALAAEIDRRLADATIERPLLVAVFDLDDIHRYAKLFGAAAADALIARLGTGLVAALGARGSVHRTGPSEFTTVMAVESAGPDRILATAAAALHAAGEGFSIGCSQGAVLLPLQAADAHAALRHAGERLREHRRERREAIEAAGDDALAEALTEREERDEQRRRLAELAEATAGKLGVRGPDREQIRVAAGLHDVGKLAIPDVILQKQGPLDEDEWRFMQEHAAIGERIVAAAPDLGAAAEIVRSIPERFDGTGYPDGLAGAAIPLGSRVVAVCGAYEAMTTDRPYRQAMPVEAALSELRRFAGIQFDPDVVEAFCLALLDRPVERET